MKKLCLALLLLSMSACANNASSEISGLYTGYEEGTWYKFSSSCSAKLCPAY